MTRLSTYLLAIAGTILTSFQFGMLVANAQGLPAVVCHAKDGESSDAMFYRDFYTGWKAYDYSLERIGDGIASKRHADVEYHARRLCRVAEGLKKFSHDLEDGDEAKLIAELNLSQGVTGALERAAGAGDTVKLIDLQRQLISIQEAASDLVPPCWRSFASTLRGRHQIACR